MHTVKEMASKTVDKVVSVVSCGHGGRTESLNAPVPASEGPATGLGYEPDPATERMPDTAGMTGSHGYSHMHGLEEAAGMSPLGSHAHAHGHGHGISAMERAGLGHDEHVLTADTLQYEAGHGHSHTGPHGGVSGMSDTAGMSVGERAAAALGGLGAAATGAGLMGHHQPLTRGEEGMVGGGGSHVMAREEEGAVHGGLPLRSAVMEPEPARAPAPEPHGHMGSHGTGITGAIKDALHVGHPKEGTGQQELMPGMTRSVDQSGGFQGCGTTGAVGTGHAADFTTTGVSGADFGVGNTFPATTQDTSTSNPAHVAEHSGGSSHKGPIGALAEVIKEGLTITPPPGPHNART